MKRWLALFISLVTIDVLTKVVALKMVPPLIQGSYPFGGTEIFELGPVTFSLNLIGNTGAAWGLFQGYSGLLFSLRCVIIGALILYLLIYNKGKYPSLPLWMIASGAVGNAIDYGVYGYVVDFLHFTFWGWSFPIFNFADSCITVGAILLLLTPRKSS